ncbi:MAG: RsmB/NOP family class I SAM-dependent RNA methyltransferase [Candidatus Sumerlaeia bacterium]|nr:RsmB/NOP family class I SAM-dependent RNA methyltransferase [Candidatus Sumerlaeia bacterium]
MHPNTLVDHVAELLRSVRHSSEPADRLFRNYCHARRNLGSGDRAALGDTYYHLLRHLLRVDEAIVSAFEGVPLTDDLEFRTGFPVYDPTASIAWTEPVPLDKTTWKKADRWIDQLRAAVAAEEMRPGTFPEVLPNLIKFWPTRVGEFSEARLTRHLTRVPELAAQFAAEQRQIRFFVKHSLPEWLWGQVGFGVSPKELDAAGGSLNQSAPVALRVNTLRTTRDAFLAEAASRQVAFQPGTLATSCVLAAKRLPQDMIPGFREGHAVFQDEGSQLVSEVLAPEPGWTVLDACAGAGGKTLHLAALMGGQGRLLVHDVSAGRLKNLFERARTAGITIVEALETRRDPAPPDDPAARPQLVLLDVPCTGTGTLRRSPELKWRLNRALLQKRVVLQRELLDRWSAWVRPGGLLAYSTCSLLHEENGARIDDFLATHPDFTRVPLTGRAGLREDMILRSGDLQLYPHRHGTDGFFLALLRRAD